MSSKRNRIRNKRARLFDRDGWRCFWCGSGLRLHEATLDHIVPRSRGGGLDDDNLVVACEPCNMDRGTKPAEVYLFERMVAGTTSRGGLQ